MQLVTTLCNAGICPSTVYMDIDYLYNTGYAIDVLQRNKAALASLGVPVRPQHRRPVDRHTEAIPGSLANTVLRIFNEYLIPRGLAH